MNERRFVDLITVTQWAMHTWRHATTHEVSRVELFHLMGQDVTYVWDKEQQRVRKG